MMNSATLARPEMVVCNLKKITQFEENDVLYKIVNEDICKFLVVDVKGENRIKLRALHKNGLLTNHIFEVKDLELNYYKVDTAHTALRKAYYEQVRKNAN